jgi:asparagine synthase (glutamine-hydrolysing)
MCGIVGVFAAGPLPLGPMTGVVRDALSAISHRGESRFQAEMAEGPGFACGTNRLAFTSGQTPQPGRSASGRYLVFLNGEIYAWHGEKVSDTQLLADSLDRHGASALTQLDGIYAAIVIDLHERKGFLVRDRFGVKPLYFAKAKGALFAGSELKALAPLTIVETIEHVVPGEVVSFSLDTPDITTASPIAVQELRGLGIRKFEAFAESLQTRILNVVTSQTRDGHRYGVFLSGGIDSSIVFAAAVRAERDLVPMVLGREGSSDVHYAQVAGRHFNRAVDVIACPDERDLVALLPKIIACTESFEPNVVRQSAACWVLADGAAERGLRAVLCGEGADELFGGYPEFLRQDSDVMAVRRRFLSDLHRTQLQRVDRINMAKTIEVRVPFLADPISSLALNVNDASWLCDPASGETKRLLRAAATTLVPRQIQRRPKVVLSEGAGLRGNDPERGMFVGMIDEFASDDHLARIRREHPEFALRTKEEAYYFSIFKNCGYHKYVGARERVYANRAHTMNEGR